MSAWPLRGSYGCHLHCSTGQHSRRQAGAVRVAGVCSPVWRHAQVLCELPGLQTARAADGAPVWGQLLAATLKALEQRAEQESTEEAQPEALEDLAEESQG